MKISKKIEPIISGISASLVIGVLAFLTLRTSAGIWLMFSFGATVFLVFALYKLETAQPKNIFFGHLVSVLVGIIFNETIGFSFYSLGLSVGIAVTLMIYLKVMHPPAASNPLVVLFTDVSFEFILFPVIFGAIAIIIMSVFINKVVLKRKYPNKKRFPKKIKDKILFLFFFAPETFWNIKNNNGKENNKTISKEKELVILILKIYLKPLTNFHCIPSCDHHLLENKNI